ncbi:MAG: hypothetical protein LCH63_10375 [Candidatus Melainabacteria bacterium]|nr:hypothetical protein [Candidatus Melainabacteria bacterium]
MGQLTNERDIRSAMGYQAAGTTDVNGTSIDTAGAGKSIAFVGSVGAIVSGGVQSVKIQYSDDNSSWSDVAGAEKVLADTDDDKTFAIEIAFCLHRYYRAVLLRETQNCTLNAILAFIGDLLVEPAPAHSSHDGAVQVAAG